jgi:excisionase family DNA binding protein
MKLLGEAEVSERLGCTKACLRRWRREGRGLPFVRVGRLVRYDPGAVSGFILAHTQDVAVGCETAKESRQRELVS